MRRLAGRVTPSFGWVTPLGLECLVNIKFVNNELLLLAKITILSELSQILEQF